jgi:hypothetical protein
MASQSSGRKSIRATGKPLVRKLQDKEAWFRWLVKQAEDETSPCWALGIEATMPGTPRSQYALFGHLCRTWSEPQVRAALLAFEKQEQR